jgi:quercetin dioxygenase-like cupin family protein
LRVDASLTLQEVAGRAGLSQPFLSQLENGRSMPSLITLHRIAAALGTTAQQLLAGTDDGHISLVRREGSRVFDLSEGATMRFLVEGRRTMAANEVTAAAGADSGGHLAHEGEELLFVVDGQIEVSVGARTERLAAGDAICYDAGTAHEWKVIGRKAGRFVMVSNPPSF